MSDAVVDHLNIANQKYAASFDKGDLPIPPAKKYALVTCMDARIDTTAAFGVELGDAHIIRNAGGNAVDALRSIIISQQLLGTKEIVLVKHTGCGMLTFQNDDVYKVVQKQLGSSAHEELTARKIDFQPFPDLEKSVKDDCEFLRKTELVGKDIKITGWIYEVETGKTRQVV